MLTAENTNTVTHMEMEDVEFADLQLKERWMTEKTTQMVPSGVVVMVDLKLLRLFHRRLIEVE